MCGIAGIVYRDAARQPSHGLLASMSRSIAHRGPDSEGLLAKPGFGFSHRRLSIIDLGGGDQPVFNEDGSIGVIYNGEIYNYKALMADLRARGHQFKTVSDTEVLVHLYEEYGLEMVNKLRGMFAFALWDGRERRMVVARDRLGIKPVYFHMSGEKFVFGSEIQAVLADESIAPEIDPQALESYLALGMVPGPMSIFSNIEKLPPGHIAVLDTSTWSFSQRRYWQLERNVVTGRSEADWIEAIAEKLDEAVQLHLVSDVPVGAFLSGGVDSSLIVMTASRLLGEPMHTFSIGIEEGGETELPYARAVSDAAGSRHTEELVTLERALEEAVSVAGSFDEPFADTSAVPTLLVSRLARSAVKVVLSGDGGDEGFAGYDRYAHDLWEDSLRSALPSAARRVCALLGQIWPRADYLPRVLRAKTLLENLGLPADQAYANTVTTARQPWRRRLLRPEWVESLADYAPTGAVSAAYRAGADGALEGMLSADVEVILPDRFLTKVDRASMSVSLEVRPPLLDHELLELAASIPPDLLLQNREPKVMLKKVARKSVPVAALDRPKRGFHLPTNEWFRGALGDRYLAEVVEGNGAVNEWISPEYAATLLREHRSRRANHGELLWTVLTLALWSQRQLTRTARCA